MQLHASLHFHLRRLMVCVTISVAALSHVAPAQTFTNPIVGGGADPWVTQWKGQYFYTRTTGSDVKVSRSPWLQSLNSNSRQVWNPPTNTPYGQNIWVPELHRLNDKWYMYVAADNGADANHRMFVLEGDSQDPQGSYTLKGQISIPSNRWAIDGTISSTATRIISDAMVTDESDWQVKIDGMTLDFAAVDAAAVPEPAMGALIFVAGTWALRRQRRRHQGTPTSETWV